MVAVIEKMQKWLNICERCTIFTRRDTFIALQARSEWHFQRIIKWCTVVFIR